MKKIFVALSFYVIFTYNAVADWNYSESRGSVFTVYKTKDESWNSVYLSLEVSDKRVTIQALIPLREYKKYFTPNLQPIFIVDGIRLVKYESFFWGKENQQVSINIDHKTYGGFSILNGYQVTIKGPKASDIVDAMKVGNILKLNHHYWSPEKLYPTFSLTGFTAAYNRFFKAIENGAKKENFPISRLHCITTVTKKIVWIKTDRAIYILNGQALEFFDLLDSNVFRGIPRRKGRDYLDSKLLGELIKKGLQLCD